MLGKQITKKVLSLRPSLNDGGRTILFLESRVLVQSPLNCIVLTTEFLPFHGKVTPFPLFLTTIILAHPFVVNRRIDIIFRKNKNFL